VGEQQQENIMAAQRGRDLLLKVDSMGAGSFQTVAGLRTHAISFNAETVDVTHQESAGAWRELLAGAGIKSAAIRGSGLFKDEASDATVRSIFFAGTLRDWQVMIPDFGIVAGPFQITSLEIAGRHDAEVTFELALASAGALTFSAL
jgi:TP901-1 family phage major tail protein